MLGPLRVRTGGGWQPVRAPQQRTVLATLVAESGHPVSSRRLMREIWGEQPPPTADATIRGYIGALRRLLAPTEAALVRRDGGYALVVAEGVDAAEFEALVARGRAADDQVLAIECFDAALGLWRGAALADVPAAPTPAALARRLDELRLAVREERLAVLIEAGEAERAIDDSRLLVTEHPSRERFWELLMTALDRSGRRREALRAYDRAREAIGAQLGLEPRRHLQRLRRAILDGGTTLPGRSTEPVVGQAQLPGDLTTFSGRGEQIGRLNAFLDDRHPTAANILIVSGIAGVGKSALVVRWAHQVRASFPDGRLFLDLAGFGPGDPLRPIDALTRVLTGLGVEPSAVPPHPDRASALFRSIVASKRVLLILDNAASADQVRPLLPSGVGSAVVVTSRERLIDLVARDGAQRLDLDVLTDSEARTLLATLLAGRPAPETQLAELAYQCGHLPLALRIAAADLTTHPELELDAYLTRLAQDRLGVLAISEDPSASVRVAFDHSFASLPEPSRMLLCLLGLVPGPDVTPAAAAALAGLPVRVVEEQLDRLAAAHLVEEYALGRYLVHDLVRAYAAQRVAADVDAGDRERAMGSLLDYYLAHADAAADRLTPQVVRLRSSTRDAARFETDGDALAWMDAERTNLTAAVASAAQHGPHQAAWELADAIRGYLYIGTHGADWSLVAHAALAAARAQGDPGGQAAAHLSLGVRHWVYDEYEEAIAEYGLALPLARAAGWSIGEAVVQANLGSVSWAIGDLRQARLRHETAARLHGRAGRLALQAVNVGNLGLVHFGLGQLEVAAQHHAQAMTLFEKAGSAGGRARSLAGLAEAWTVQGRLRDAHAALDHALAVQREVGDRYSEAYTRRLLADVHRDGGRLDDAMELGRRALTQARATGDRRYEIDARIGLAATHVRRGEAAEAIALLEPALKVALGAGIRYGACATSIGLADACVAAGRSDEAVTLVATAVALAREHGYRLLEGHALGVTALIHLAGQNRDAALGAAQQALAVHAGTGHRAGQARAHGLVAAAQRLVGTSRDAGNHQRHADILTADLASQLDSR